MTLAETRAYRKYNILFDKWQQVVSEAAKNHRLSEVDSLLVDFEIELKGARDQEMTECQQWIDANGQFDN